MWFSQAWACSWRCRWSIENLLSIEPVSQSPSVVTLESHHALRGMKKLTGSLFSRLVKGQKIIQYLRLKNIDDPSGMIQRISAMIFNNLIELGPLKWSQKSSQTPPAHPFRETLGRARCAPRLFLGTRGDPPSCASWGGQDLCFKRLKPVP